MPAPYSCRHKACHVRAHSSMKRPGLSLVATETKYRHVSAILLTVSSKTLTFLDAVMQDCSSYAPIEHVN